MERTCCCWSRKDETSFSISGGVNLRGGGGGEGEREKERERVRRNERERERHSK